MAVDCRLRFGARPSSRIKRALRDESTTVFADFFDPETGQNVEVSGVTATVYLPGGATEAPTPTRQGVGVWSVDVTPAFTGNYRVLMACSSPDTASDTIDFRVFAPEPDPSSPPASTSVLTVAGRTGNVVLSASDVGFTRGAAGAVSTGLPAELNRLPFHVDQFGAVGDGVTDDRAAIQAALNACNAAGGGVVKIGPKRYRVTGPTDLVVPKGVSLEGDWSNPGELEGRDFTQQKYALLLDGCEITYRTNSAIRNLAVLRYGMATPTSVRTALDLIASFSGKAIRNSLADGDLNGQDATLENLLILGFEWAIWHDGWPRFDVRNISADCTNGIRLRRCYDVGRFENIQFWSYLTTKFAWTYDSYAAASFADNGSGRLRVTTSVDHPFVTGDKANIVTTAGPLVRKRSTVTVISSTVLDFDTVDYDAGYTAAGANVWPGTLYRDGDAFYLTEADRMGWQACFCYGYRTGWRLGDGYQYSQHDGCATDNYLPSTPDDSVAILLEGTGAPRGNSFTNWWNGPCWTAILSNCTTLAPNRVQGTFNCVAGTPRALDLRNGRIIIGPAETAYAGTAYVGPGMDELTFIACNFNPYWTLEIDPALPTTVISADTATRWLNTSALPQAGGVSRLVIGRDAVGLGQNTVLWLRGNPTSSTARGAEWRMTNYAAPGGSQDFYCRIQTAGTMELLPADYAGANLTITQAGTVSVPRGALIVGSASANVGPNTPFHVRGNPNGISARGAEVRYTNPAASVGVQDWFTRVDAAGAWQMLEATYTSVRFSISQTGLVTTPSLAVTTTATIAAGGSLTIGGATADGGAADVLVLRGSPTSAIGRGGQIRQENPTAGVGYHLRVNNVGEWQALNNAYTDSPLTLRQNSDVLLGGTALTTSSTEGFVYIPSVAGAPTGTPIGATGRTAIVVDETNLRLYVRIGGAWRYATLT